MSPAPAAPSPTPSAARSLVYESTDFRVWHVPRPSPAVVVTFDFWQRGRDGFGDFSGGSLMDRAGWSHVHVGTRRNNWFLRPDTDALIEAVARTVRPYETITTHGNSMGGYAALLMGGRIGATRAVAISPQFSVDPRKTPFDTQWADDLPEIDFTWDRLGEWAGGLRHAQVLYDPRVPVDAQHVALMRRAAPHWQIVPLAGSGHPSLGVFRETGSAAALIERLLTQAVPPAEIVRLFKQKRRASTMFWDQLARRAAGRPDRLARIVDQVLALPRAHPDSLFKLTDFVFDAGHHALAARLLARLEPALPNPSPWMLKRIQRMRRTLPRP